MKKFEIGDLAEYKGKLHLVVEKQDNLLIGEDFHSYMYQLDGVERWILDHFLEKVDHESR